MGGAYNMDVDMEDRIICNSIVSDVNINRREVTINDIPVEILEWILSLIPPYSDLIRASQVSLLWRSAAMNVMKQSLHRLYKAIIAFDIRWESLTPMDLSPSITRRFSHASLVYNDSMYVFGGRTTNMTTFNDLWRFDLSKRQWIRPLTMGAYPTPKACASMVCYRDKLILFGGWTYSSQFRTDLTLFNELHYYNITTNQWNLIHSFGVPPPIAGHSAFMEGDEMVVFGGLYKINTPMQMRCSNDVWVLDLKTLVWRKQVTSTPKPATRYSQSLIKLNNKSVIVLGGVQASSNRCVYADCWMLKMEGDVWTWHEITIKNKEWAALNIWCNPAVRVGDKVVSLSRPQGASKHPITSAVRLQHNERQAAHIVRTRYELNMKRSVDRDKNVNGRRGHLPNRRANAADRPAVDRSAEETENRPSGSGIASPSASTSTNASTSVSSENGESRLKECNDNVTPCCSSSSSSTENKSNGDINLNNLDSDSKENSTNVQVRPDNASRLPGAGVKIFPKKIVNHINKANQYRMAAFSSDDSGPSDPPPQENDQRKPEPQLPLPEPPPPPIFRVPDRIPLPRPTKKLRRNTLVIRVLDISLILDGDPDSSVSWLCPKDKEVKGAPEEYIMYSLVKGKGELLMFGGVHNDANTFNASSPQYTPIPCNTLHFIKPPQDII